MLLRRPFKRICVVCTALFVISFFAYFYLGSDNKPSKPFRKYLGDFINQRFQLDDKIDDSNNVKYQSSMKCEQQFYMQNADIEIESLYEKIPFENKPGGVWTQGFDISYSPSDWNKERLEVIILPHSHHDAGWRMTLDKYFEGSTRRGLDATVDFLRKNLGARFIYAEITFLDKWWQGLSPSVRALFAKLVREGRWEIATGGWVMNDEATTHYSATITQLIEGQHWVLENLGVLPNVSWAIDVFGHSTTEAYILYKVGIKDILIHRVHYEVKKALAEKQALEFNWLQLWDSNGETKVLTHLLPFYAYDIPHTCGPNPAVCCQFDFMRITLKCPWGIQPKLINPSNVQERAQVLVDQYRKNAKLFNNNGVLLVLLGDDFRYLTAEEWDLQISNYQSLIDHINANASNNMHIRFGTLSEYFRLVRSRKSVSEFPTFHGDFFTYADRDNDYWNGYFTSRPSYKAISRFLEAEVRTADILFSLARHWSGAFNRIEKVFVALYGHLTTARRNLALFQHHDAISGTSKYEVMEDYRIKLDEALLAARNVSANSLAYLLGHNSPEVCTILEKEVLTGGSPVLIPANPRWVEASTPEFFTLVWDSVEASKTLYIFNSLPRIRDHLLRLQVNMTLLLWHVKMQVKQPQSVSFIVQPENGTTTFRVQLEPWIIFWKSHSPDPLFHLSAGPIRLAPLEVTRITLKLVTESSQSPAVMVVKPMLYGFASIPPQFAMFYAEGNVNSLVSKLESDLIQLVFDSTTGHSQMLINRKTGESHQLLVGFELMKPSPNPGSSGAYLGASYASKEHLTSETVKMRVLRGPLTEEVTTYYPQVEHTLRVYKSNTPGRLALEIENIVNLTDAKEGIELVMTLQTDVENTDGVFFTDSNCYQMVRRRYYKKVRQWGNVYPMTCAVYIEDSHHRVTLLSSQSLGVMAGEKTGEIKVWLDRKIFFDDQRGLGEALNNVKPSRSVFRVLIENILPRGETRQDLEMMPLPSLTAEAHYVLNDLNFPASQYLANFDPGRLVPSLKLMGSGFPCDYDLVTMKTFFSKSDRFNGLNSVPGSQLGIILHHTVSACGSTQLCPSFCECPYSPTSSIRLSVAFPQLVTRMAIKASLTLIPDRSGFTQPAEEISVKTMEMEGFLLMPSRKEPKSN